MHDFFSEKLRNPARNRRAGLMRQFRSGQLYSIVSLTRIQQNFPTLYFCRHSVFSRGKIAWVSSGRRDALKNTLRTAGWSTNKKFIFYYGGFWCFWCEYFCCEIVCLGPYCPILIDSGPIFTPFRPKYPGKIRRSDTLQVALQEPCRKAQNERLYLHTSNFPIKTPPYNCRTPIQNRLEKAENVDWSFSQGFFFWKLSTCSEQLPPSGVQNTLFDRVVPQYFMEKILKTGPWRF